MELIDVGRLERRVQSIENSLTISLKLNELNQLRLDAQLARIVELELAQKPVNLD